MRNLIFGLFLLLSLFQLRCERDNEQDNFNTNETDTLKQYLKFTLQDSTYELFESDSVTFNITKGYSFPTTDTNNCIVRIFSDVMIAHNNSIGTSYEHYTFTFFFRLSKSIIENSKSIPPSIIDSIFQEDSLDYLTINCPSSITTSPKVGFKHSKPNRDYLSYYPYCSFGTIYEQDDSSFFNLKLVQPYNHVSFGECVLLKGTFRVKTYYTDHTATPAEPYSETYIIKNGSFKLLITDDAWH